MCDLLCDGDLELAEGPCHPGQMVFPSSATCLTCTKEDLGSASTNYERNTVDRPSQFLGPPSQISISSQVPSCTSKLFVSPLLCSGALRRYSNTWTDVLRTRPTASRRRASHCECCVTPSTLHALTDWAYCSTGHEWALGLLPYGATWRRQRRIFWQHFHPGAIEKYRPIQLSAVHTFLSKVASDPDRLDEHIQ